MRKISFLNLKYSLNNYLYVLLLGFLILSNIDLQGQATLNIQGIIKKSSGANLDDGTYSMRFRIYTVATGSTSIWQEDHVNVDITSGVYNVVLGLITPFTISFDRTYFLGVSVDGGVEVSPRIRLTGAPYSLSLMGQKNIFPSTGSVGIGTVTPDSSARLHIKSDSDTTARFLLEGKDTAIIVMKTRADTASISFNGTKISIPDLSINYASGVSLPKGQSVKYNTLSTWQLVQVDTLLNSGWLCYDDWKTTNSKTMDRIGSQSPFNSFILRPNLEGNNIIAKQIDLGGIPHTMVKIVFTFHFFDTWDEGEFGFAAFGSKQNPYDGAGQTSGILQIGWRQYAQPNFNTLFSSSGYFKGDSALASSDYNIQGEMVAQTDANTFWVLFGSNLEQAATDESYGISNIQVWVR